ncbi:hypothetical protein KKC22_15155 [Myxococcota bacterium]|nr:hypothetical protein [Myxococcota bacterium]
MKSSLLWLLLAGGLFACDSPHRSVVDVLGDRDVSTDEADCPDSADVVDVMDVWDSSDIPDATGFPTDPDEHLIVCNRKLVAVSFPWVYYSLRKRVEEDGHTIPFEAPFRFHLETRMEEILPELDKISSGQTAYINANTRKMYTPVRSLRYLDDPLVDGEYGPWILSVTDVVTGVSTEWAPGFELLSEDCQNYDLFSGVGRAVMGVWKISDDESEAVFACWYGPMDIYKMDLRTGEKTHLLRGSEEPAQFGGTTGWHFQDPGGDFISFTLGYWSTTLADELRVWNWRTGELVWSFSDPALAGILSTPAEDGWVYYTMREPRNGDWYLRIDGYNILTGETGSPPVVMENQLAATPAIQGRPEYIFFMAGDGPITSAEPRLPTGEKHYYLWNRETDIVRRVTRIPISYGNGILALGQNPPQTAIYQISGGTFPCYYSKNLIDAGIMDPLGNLLPEP